LLLVFVVADAGLTVTQHFSSATVGVSSLSSQSHPQYVDIWSKAAIGLLLNTLHL